MTASPHTEPTAFRSARRQPLDDGPRVLLLPGWQDSGPAHWQSRWEALYGYRRVEQADWLWPRRGDWMARLDEVLLQGESRSTPSVLVAHSLGCQLVAAWAAHSRHTARVVAALLVAPPDTERTDLPPHLFNWRPVAREPLSFPSRVVISVDDPYCTPARAVGMAHAWQAGTGGGDVVRIGACGHINDESGLGEWPAGHALLLDLLSRLPATPAPA